MVKPFSVPLLTFILVEFLLVQYVLGLLIKILMCF